jgi:hypothetical protein
MTTVIGHKSNTDPRTVLGFHGKQHQPNGVWTSIQTNSRHETIGDQSTETIDPDTDGGLSDTANKFQGLKLDSEGPEDIDVKIAQTDREQRQEDRLGKIIKNLTVRPKSRAGTSQYIAPSITAMMSTTMTQNQPHPHTSDGQEEEEIHPVEDHPLEADSSAAVSDLSVEGHQEEAEEAPLEVTPEETKQPHRTKVMEVVEENSKEKNPESSLETRTKAKSSNSNGTSTSPSITTWMSYKSRSHAL